MLRYLIVALALIGIGIGAWRVLGGRDEITGAPPFGEPLERVPPFGSSAYLSKWKRPEGPPRVGLQVGHWKSSEFPEELA